MNLTINQLQKTSRQLGLVLMSTAAIAGLVELPEDTRSRAVVPSQPAFAFANEMAGDHQNPLRREKEEAGPHYVSYSAAMRTPGRTGH